MSATHIPITADANVDALADALDDTVEFFQTERVESGRLWSRYVVLACERDDVRTLTSAQFRDLLAKAAAVGAVDVTPFGIRRCE